MRLYLAPQPSLDLIRYLRSTSGDAGLEGAAVRKKALNEPLTRSAGSTSSITPPNDGSNM